MGETGEDTQQATEQDPGWDTPGRDQETAGAQPQHPRTPDAERAEGGTDTVERDSDADSEHTADDTPVKDDVGDEGWATQSGAQDDEGALGQD